MTWGGVKLTKKDFNFDLDLKKEIALTKHTMAMEMGVGVFTSILSFFILEWFFKDIFREELQNNPSHPMPEQLFHDTYRIFQKNNISMADAKKYSRKLWNGLDEDIQKGLIFEYKPNSVDISELKELPDTKELVKNFKQITEYMAVQLKSGDIKANYDELLQAVRQNPDNTNWKRTLTYYPIEKEYYKGQVKEIDFAMIDRILTRWFENEKETHLPQYNKWAKHYFCSQCNKTHYKYGKGIAKSHQKYKKLWGKVSIEKYNETWDNMKESRANYMKSHIINKIIQKFLFSGKVETLKEYKVRTGGEYAPQKRLGKNWFFHMMLFSVIDSIYNSYDEYAIGMIKKEKDNYYFVQGDIEGMFRPYLIYDLKINSPVKKKLTGKYKDNSIFIYGVNNKGIEIISKINPKRFGIELMKKSRSFPSFKLSRDFKTEGKCLCLIVKYLNLTLKNKIKYSNTLLNYDKTSDLYTITTNFPKRERANEKITLTKDELFALNIPDDMMKIIMRDEKGRELYYKRKIKDRRYADIVQDKQIKRMVEKVKDKDKLDKFMVSILYQTPEPNFYVAKEDITKKEDFQKILSAIKTVERKQKRRLFSTFKLKDKTYDLLCVGIKPLTKDIIKKYNLKKLDERNNPDMSKIWESKWKHLGKLKHPKNMSKKEIQVELNSLLFDEKTQNKYNATDPELLTIIIIQDKSPFFDFLKAETKWEVKGRWHEYKDDNYLIEVQFMDNKDEGIGNRVIHLLNEYNVRFVKEELLYARTTPIEEGTLQYTEFEGVAEKGE